MAKLSDEIHSEIQRLCATGDELAKARRFADAIPMYWTAWDLLPEPKTDWSAALWILAAIGDANFLGGDYVAGRDNLSQAMHCPGAIGNPFVHMRLGQCQFELNAVDRAADELMRAYMGAGPDIFKDENPRYLAFLKTKAKDIETPKKPWQFWKR
ncbi:tetratricopeptide repeat protein [Rhodoferax sp. AJA081-3]|nr:tetratricopeptide repeat protein [Rhodoferax sp. AJA081-3]